MIMVRCTTHPHHTHISLTRHSTLFTPIHNSFSSYLTHTVPLSLLTLLSSLSLTSLAPLSLLSHFTHPTLKSNLTHIPPRGRPYYTSAGQRTLDFYLESPTINIDDIRFPLLIFCVFLLFLFSQLNSSN